MMMQQGGGHEQSFNMPGVVGMDGGGAGGMNARGRKVRGPNSSSPIGDGNDTEYGGGDSFKGLGRVAAVAGGRGRSRKR